MCRAWPSPHNPAQVIAEAAAELKRYGLKSVQVDRYGGEFPAEQFRLRGVTAETAKGSTSDHYLELLPLVNAGGVVLLDDADLLRELRGLERRAGTSGKDRVDHRRGSHDDRAAAAAGALVQAAREPGMTGLTWGEPRRFVGVGTAARRVQPSSHNPRVAQDLVDYVEPDTDPPGRRS